MYSLIAVREARNTIFKLTDEAQQEPGLNEHNGRSEAVVNSAKEYEQIKRDKLQASFTIGGAKLEAGQGYRQSATEVITQHKPQHLPVGMASPSSK